MIATAPVQIEVRTHSDGRITLNNLAWPEATALSDHLIRTSAPGYFIEHYPFLTIRLANARATYRLGTCDRGIWSATLLEGWVEGQA